MNLTLSTLYRFEVLVLREDEGEEYELAFECLAEDMEHAGEQALDAYPDGEVIAVHPIR